MATENILATYAKIWYAPLNEAAPDETTVAYGAAWGGNWDYLGDTLTPLTLATSTTKRQVKIQQSTSPVKEFMTGQEFTLKTVLAEHTPGTYNLLWQGALTTTAAGASQKAYSELAFGGESAIAQYKWGFEILFQDANGVDHPWRYIFHRGSIAQDGDLEFDRENEKGIPVAITILGDTSKSVGAQGGIIQFVTAPATS